MAEQSFIRIAHTCGLKPDSTTVRKWLPNNENPWVLLVDNANDSEMDVSQLFPADDRGTVLLTTRNPDCKVHATVRFKEIGIMVGKEAITLLFYVLQPSLMRTTVTLDIPQRPLPKS